MDPGSEKASGNERKKVERTVETIRTKNQTLNKTENDSLSECGYHTRDCVQG